MLIVKIIKVPVSKFTYQYYHRTYQHHFLTERHYPNTIDLRKDEFMKTLFLGALNRVTTTLFEVPSEPSESCCLKFALPSSWEKYTIDPTRLKALKKSLDANMHRMLVQHFSILETITTWEKASEIMLDLLDMPDYPLDHIHRYFSRYGSQHLGMDRHQHKKIVKQILTDKVPA